MLILLLVFDWRQRADTQLPAYLLNFRALAEASKALFLHSYIPESKAAEQGVCGISCFPTEIFGKTLDLLYFDIKLQERTLRCQLKFCSKGLKRSRYGSLHAYLPTDLAVETSQPHGIK